MRLTHAVPVLLVLGGLAQLAGGDATPAIPPVPTEAAVAVPPPTLSDAQRTALLALYERAVAAGFPDAAGGTLVVGTLTVSEPAAAADSARRSMMRGIGRRTNSSTNNGTQTTTYGRAIHVRFPDGRWLLNLCDPLRTDPTHLVTPGEGFQEATPATLLTVLTGGTAAQRNQQQAAQAFLAVFTAADRARLTASLEIARPFADATFSGDQGTIVALHLLRLGVPQADALLVTTSAMTALPYFRRQFPGLNLPGPLGLSEDAWMRGMRRGRQPDWQAFLKDNDGKLAIPAPEPVVGQAIATWFTNLLLDEKALAGNGLSAPKAAEGVLAFSADADRTTLRPLVDLLVARLALPAQASADADLATRLQSWEPAPRGGNEGPDIDEATLAKMPPEVQQHFRAQLAQRKAWRPGDADCAALLELLTDPRPSRWLDGRTPRTLGDNALRALNAAFGFDPRLLAGREVDASWTAAERLATAEALRTWWKTLAGKPLVDGLAAAIGGMPPAAMAALLSARPAETRPVLVDAIVASWTAKPPLDQLPHEVAAVLAAVGDHAGMTALVKAWKPEGKLRPLLACWRDRHGDPSALDAILDELCATPSEPAAPGGSGGGGSPLSLAIAQSLRSPSAARLQRTLALARGAPGDVRTWAVLSAIARIDNNSDADWAAVNVLDSDNQGLRRQRGNQQSDPARAIPLAVASVLLADRRVVPASALSLKSMGGNWAQLAIAGTQFHVQLPKTAEAKPGERPLPGDLRVCDFAGTALLRTIWQFGIEDAQELNKNPLDLWTAADARDRALLALTEAFAEAARAALAAAKLPDVVPAAAPPADDKGMF